MEWTAIVAALISAGVASVSLVHASGTERKRARDSRSLAVLESEFRRRELAEVRREGLEARLNEQREPLIEAIEDLRSRLHNIRDGSFLESYMDEADTRRRELAVLSTLYRVGKYFAAVETVRRGVDTWTLEHDPATRGVAAGIGDVSRTFATDEFAELMIWREEQRAIGELMLPTNSTTPIGFARFAERYDADFHRWFAGVREELGVPGLAASARLDLLEGCLGELRAVLVAGRRINAGGERSGSATSHQQP